MSIQKCPWTDFSPTKHCINYGSQKSGFLWEIYRQLLKTKRIPQKWFIPFLIHKNFLRTLITRIRAFWNSFTHFIAIIWNIKCNLYWSFTEINATEQKIETSHVNFTLPRFTSVGGLEHDFHMKLNVFDLFRIISIPVANWNWILPNILCSYYFLNRKSNILAYMC